MTPPPSITLEVGSKAHYIKKVFKDPRIKRVGRPRKDDWSQLFDEIDICKPNGKPRSKKFKDKIERLRGIVVDVDPSELVRLGRRGEPIAESEGEEASFYQDSSEDESFKPGYLPKGGPKRRPRRAARIVSQYSRSEALEKVEKIMPSDLSPIDPPVKRKRGRPRKNPDAPIVTRPLTRKSTSSKLKPRAATEELVPPPKFYTFEDSDDETSTKFVFLEDPTKSQSNSPLKSSKQRTMDKDKFIKMDVFASPKKQKVGLIQLFTTQTSPSKKGIPKLLISPTKTPNGRSGTPRKLAKQRELQDKSARKKANYKLYRLLEDGVGSDDEDTMADKLLAERIIQESRQQALPDASASVIINPSTPSKNKDNHVLPTFDPNFVPTPLPTFKEDQEYSEGKHDDKALFLDGPDAYFDQHRYRAKQSTNSLVMGPQLEYDEFNSLILLSGFFHFSQRRQLVHKYQLLYSQWLFELQSGLNLIFYGIGSKRLFLLDFVQNCVLQRNDECDCLVINGYNPLTSFNEILKQIVVMLKLKKVPKRIGEIVDHLITHFAKKKTKDVELVILFHNIDSEPLRDERTQDYISKLAAIPQIQLIASMDHISTPLLWDSTRLANFNFTWHNITTFQDYLTEMSFKDPLTFGQQNNSSGSKGAKYVLSSLTTNSRNLYKILATQQLSLMQDEELSKGNTSRHLLRGSIKHGLEFQRLFQLCAEEFISSNEINFRTMFMEFVEHKMAMLTKDPSGVEMAFIPFTMDEIAKLLEHELV